MITKAEQVRLLQEARELIESPMQWTQRRFARSSNGNGVDPLAPNACTFCLDGALRRVIARHFDQNSYASTHDQLTALIEQELPNPMSPDGNIVSFNDDPRTQHADVLALIDRAIAEIAQ